MRLILVTLALAVAAAATPKDLVVPVKTSTGQDAGSVTFKAGKEGKLDVKFALKNLPTGVHGFHIHQAPLCDAPDFKSAAAHMDPLMHQHQNVTIAPDGTTPTHFEFPGLTYGTGKDNDVLLHGASIIIHEKPDDMVTDQPPTGNAGNRIACGIIPAASGSAKAAADSGNLSATQIYHRAPSVQSGPIPPAGH